MLCVAFNEGVLCVCSSSHSVKAEIVIFSGYSELEVANVHFRREVKLVLHPHEVQRIL